MTRLKFGLSWRCPLVEAVEANDPVRGKHAEK